MENQQCLKTYSYLCNDVMLRRCPPGAQLPCMGDCRVWNWTFRTDHWSKKENSSIDWVMDLWCNMVKFLGSEFDMTITPGPQ
jgi:hypothetical protein